MYQKAIYRMFVFILLVGMLTGLVQPVSAKPVEASGIEQETTPFVEPELSNEIRTNGSAGYLIYFREKPDLSAAEGLDWGARGEYVMKALQQAAEKSQAGVRAYLDQQGVRYQAFWIDNIISVEGSGLTVFNQLQTFSQVEALRAHRVLGLIEPEVEPTAENQIMAVEPNITHVGAPGAWGLGIDGSGLVVANIDTGVRYSHDALAPHYRGNTGGTFDHNYSWLDPYEIYDYPADDNGHGTHTMGTIVGDDGGSNQIGMAPGSEWIACRGCDTDSCSSAALLTCAQFMAAPTDLAGANPNPALRPHVVNNSWGDCEQTYDSWYQGVVDAWHAAGIYPVFSNGNASNCSYSYPPGLNTVGNPARYGNVTGVGSSGESNGLYADHSNWGPTDNPDTVNPAPGYADLKPQVIAPGVSIRSSVPSADDAYEDGWSGTSMSAPHVSGLVALVWQAGACLVGDYAATETLIEQTANPVPYDDGTGGGAHVPNYATGWGEIDALAAVQAAINFCGDSTLTGTVTDASSGLPVAGAEVVASDGIDTRTAYTNASGLYSIYLYGGIYDVSVSEYGFQAATEHDVVVTSGQTNTLNLNLTPVSFYTISGYVVDYETGWPVYSKISIDGYPGGAIWNDPVNGQFEISLAEGITYTFTPQAWTDGYLVASWPIGPLTGDKGVGFNLHADALSCSAPGYEQTVTLLSSESFNATTVPTGWTVTDNAGTGAVWTFNDPGGRANLTGGTGSFAIADSDAAGSINMDTELRSPALDFSGETNVILEFKYDFNQYVAEIADVDISANGGASWTNVWRRSGADDRGPKTATLDLSAQLAGQANAMVRFHYYNANLEWWWQLDDVLLSAYDCVPPASGGLVVGNVYDANTGLPLTGAEVEHESGSSTTTAATEDPDVDDAFYVLYSPSGLNDFTASKDLYTSQTDPVDVSNHSTVAHDFTLAAGHLTVAPLELSATLELGATETQSLDLTNDGTSIAYYGISEITGSYTAAASVEMTPALSERGSRRIDLTLASSPGSAGVQSAAWPASGPIQLVLDDGSAENSIMLTGGGQFVWFNRFTPNPTDFPFVLDQVSMLFDMTTIVGDSLQILIWEDTDGDGDPGTGASLLYSGTAAVQYNDLITWNVFNLATPVEINGPGDVLIGLVNRSGVIGYADYPAAVDDSTSQQRSWVGAYVSGPADPPTLPADSLWGTIDSLGYPGNWTLRASGLSGTANVPWLREDPISGALSVANSDQIDVTFDASVVTQPGTYQATLRITHDAPQPVWEIPVEMIVTPPNSMGKLEGTVTGLGYCDDNPAPLEGIEIEISGPSMTQTLHTDASGYYSYWFDVADGPLTVATAPADHTSVERTNVVLTGGETTTVDFSPRWLRPCATVDPGLYDVSVVSGYSLVETLEISNGGAGDLDWEVFELPSMITVLGEATPVVTAPVPEIVTIGDIHLSANPDAKQGSAAFSAPAAPNADTITHSTSQTILDGNSVYCNAGGQHTDNHYLRTFTLSDFGILDHFNVTSVQIGIETALAGSGGTQPAEIRLYTLDGAFVWANMTLIGSAPVTVADSNLTIITMPVEAFVLAGSTLVVDFFTPNGQSAGHSLFVGSNNLGQTAPTYLAAPDCGVTEPTDTASIGFPGMHLVMNVTGEVLGGNLVPWLDEDPISGTLEADSSEPVEITFTAFPTMTVGATYEASLLVKNSDENNDLVEIPVSMTVVAPSYGVELTAAQTSAGVPGDVVSYAVQVTNTGNVPDTFDLSVAGDWPAAVVPASVSLDAGASTTVVVEVTVPAAATFGDLGVNTLTAVSHADPSASALVMLTTTVMNNRLMLPIVIKP